MKKLFDVAGEGGGRLERITHQINVISRWMEGERDVPISMFVTLNTKY